MHQLAYGKRNHTRIFIRKIKYYLFRVLKEVVRRLKKPGYIRSILYYPAVADAEQCADLLNRAAWALPGHDQLKIYIPIPLAQQERNINKLTPPPDQEHFLHQDLSHFSFIEDITPGSLQADSILFHDTRNINIFKFISRIHKIHIVDKHFYSSVESRVYQDLLFDTFSPRQRERYETLSRDNFSRLLQRSRGKHKAYCFVTGPSFQQYDRFQYGDDSIKIICNSIVKNRDFLKYIGKPDLLTFADPVFHFGPSKYASRFRQYVLEVVKEYNCFVMVPYETVPLMLTHYPDLETNIIGMKQKKKCNFPSLESFHTTTSNNILLKFMLPTASALADEIYIIGADGREKGEKYFWKHNSTVQFDDLMESAFNTHPSFFRDRIYSAYYKKYCRHFENLISYGESSGKKYYSLTPSHISALKKRLAQ